MKIALTADPELPVPPRHYGGIERVIDLLAHGLVRRGHEVTLFAHRQSHTAGRLVPWPGDSSGSWVNTLGNSATLAKHLVGGGYDVVHSFSRLAYLMPVLPLPLPKIMTYQRAVTRKAVRRGHGLSRGTLSFTAVSDWMMAGVRDVGTWAMVPNGVPLDIYDFAPTVAADAPLVFLGRIEEIKGPHLAIDIARRSGRRLVIAGNIPDEKRAWAEGHVLRHVDGDAITYVGPVDDRQKNALLGTAAAFLMPILWDEPFGIVMAEALACGTPVLGLRRGSVPEVVEHGVSGFIADTADQLVEAVAKIGMLDRRACRRRAETHYSADVTVDSYLAAYRAAIAATGRAAQ